MEAVIYNHADEDAPLRRAHLRQAMQAFLADTASCAAVQLIALFVRIPTPSTITATAVAHKASKKATTTTTTSTTAGAASSSTTTTTAVAAPAAAAASSVPKRQRSAQKLTWCALEADRRLRQATEDASELNRWLVHGTLTARHDLSHSGATAASSVLSSASAQARVVVVAYLEPQTREDLVVYESWQRCAEGAGKGRALTSPSSNNNSSASGMPVSQTTRRLSPLRRAAFIALSCGAPSLLLSWADHASPRCFLSNLLLPHQSLLMDLSWCVTASTTSSVEVKEDAVERGGSGGGAGKATGAVKRVTSQVLLDLFTQDVLPSLKFPKGDSRTAFWLSYASLMAALHPRAFLSDSGADLRLAAQTPRDRFHREGAPRELTNGEAFAKTHRLLRQVFAGLYQSNSAAAPGRTQALRVVLGYGGPVASLTRQLIHLHGHQRQMRERRRNGIIGSALNYAAPAVDAALLRTRSLVDMHALFGVLVGSDRTDFYAAAASFVRTASRRAAAGAPAAVMMSMVRNAGSGTAQTPALYALESTLVEVKDVAHGTLLPGATGTPNAFVDIGKRALARRRQQLERRRFGKAKSHLRPRDHAARAHKRLVAKQKQKRKAIEAQQGTSAKVPAAAAAGVEAAAGKKRRGSEAETASAVPTGACDERKKSERSDVAPTKKAKKEIAAAAASPANLNETLSWSVDIG